VSAGSITFLKTVDNSAGGSAGAGDFAMTLTSTDGGQTYTGNHNGDTITVASDTYTLTESSLPNYTSLYGGGCYNTANSDSSGAVVTVTEGDTWICGFTNTYVPPANANVTFLKTVDNSAGGSASAGDFKLTLTNNDPSGPSYSGYSGDVNGVLPGTYTLTEASLPGYTSIYGGGCYNNDTQANSGAVVTFAAGENWVCGFTNTYVPATVTFLKTVDNSAGGTASAGDFKITLTNNDPSGPSYSGYNGDVSNVLPGTYTLTEASLPGYTSIYGGGCYNSDTQANSGAVVTIGYSENWVCGFTNTYVPSTVTFLKTVDNSAGGSAGAGDFKLTLTNNDPSGPSYSGYNGDVSNVLPGTYTLTEASLPGYTSIYGGGCYNSDTQANSAAVVTIGYSENWVCGFTNTYMPAPTPTSTASESASPTPAPSATSTASESASPTPAPSASASVTPTPAPTASSSASSSATPTASATASSTASSTATHLPSPTAMPDTSTGGSNDSGGGALPIVLIGLILLLAGGSYSLWRAHGFTRP
jgi:adhesin HecA-like repeat protein